ncbi:MAG: fibronectin type III domain-containing protein [Dehalococcoidia bacterium]
MRKKVLALVALLTIVLTLIPVGGVLASLGISPTQGVVGLMVTAGGLTSGVSYNIKWDDVSIQQGTADTNGSASFAVPESYGGEHTVKIEVPTGTQVFSGTFTVMPYIAITPSSGATGTAITVAGHGFGVSEKNIAVTYDGTIASSGITANANGAWSTSMSAPAATRGVHNIDASGDVTKASDVADKPFTISPVVKMDPISGGVGTLVTLTGSGFGTAEGIKVQFSAKDVRTGLTTQIDGSWSTSFAVPSSNKGSHIVNIIGDNTSAKDIPNLIFTVSPGVSASPGSAYVGDDIQISGNGFANNESSIEVLFDGKQILRNLVADDTGYWSSPFKLPESVNGAHTLTADGRMTSSSDVTASSITTLSQITVVPKAGFVKDELRVTGSGFSGSKDFSVSFGVAPAASGTTNDSGSFQTIFNVPGGKSGPITITATDLKNVAASTVFTIDITPPDVPQISSPRDGATVGFMGNTKVSFKWTDVTSRNGITYDLEVSDQSNFAKTLISQTKLTQAKYTLSEAEALTNGEYYWHVRAVDGAGNTSAWTTASLVKVGFLTTTTLILIAVGVVALIVLVAVLRRKPHKKRIKRDWE